MTESTNQNTQDRDHILIFSIGQHSYRSYFEAIGKIEGISKIPLTHVFFISNREIIDEGKDGRNIYMKLRDDDKSLKSNPDLEDLFEFQKKYTNPFFEGSKSITPLQIDGLIVTKTLDVIKETQKIINDLHTKEGKDLVDVIKKKKKELTYLLENSFLREESDLRSIPEDDFEKYDFGHKLRKKIPPVVIAEIEDKGMGYTHIIVDDGKSEKTRNSPYENPVREAISEALVKYSTNISDFAKPCIRKRVEIGSDSSKKWNNPKYSFHISAGRYQMILRIYTMAMWLDADVYLSPRESGLQRQQLPGLGSPLSQLKEKVRQILRQLHNLRDDEKATKNDGYISGPDIYLEDEYKCLYDVGVRIGTLRQDFSRCSEQLEEKGYVECKRVGKNKYLKLTEKGMYICSILKIHDSYE